MANMAIEIDPAGAEPGVILQAADLSGARVLEVGAGDGRLTFRYAETARCVVGIDTKEPEIRSAANAPVGLCRRAQFLCASATDMPFAGGVFEIVLMASSL
jgi:ubiquinone/menaquinone biosynthesis C-methylase UbiE